MKVQIKDSRESKKELLIEINEDEITPFLEKSSFKISKDLKIPGFRQGKVPFEILKGKIGAMRIYEEAAIMMIPEFYIKAILDKKIGAIGRPKIEITKIVPGQGVTFRAETDILPEIILPDYKKIRVKKEKIGVKDSDIEKELRNIQKKRAKFVTVLREAEKGDRVEIDFESFLGNAPLQGGKSKNNPLIIGESYFIKGFDEELIGLKGNDKKEFSLVFPRDYSRKNLAGKKVNFKVEMKLVQERILDAINDEFACALGKFENLESLKKSLKEGILKEKNIKAKERARIKIIEEIVKKTKFSKIPESLLDAELAKIISEFKANLSRLGVLFEEYLKQIGKNEEKFKEEMRPETERRVKNSLILKKVSEREKIEVTKEEIEEKINETLKFYKNEDEARKKLDLNELREYIRSILQNQKTLDFLENLCVK